MREIKFRVWDKASKEMVNIYRIDIGDGSCKPGIFSDVFYDYWNDVELMQYTGLKDINGKKIYEGDIVKHIAEIKKDIIIGPVIFKEGCFAIKTTYGDKYLYTGINTVIGNIYENPKLVEDIE